VAAEINRTRGERTIFHFAEIGGKWRETRRLAISTDRRFPRGREGGVDFLFAARNGFSTRCRPAN